MNMKQILSVAMITILPITANADIYTYNEVEVPAHMPSGGLVTIAPGGPYATVVIDDDDDEHIASTAYVKGAYNDTIAALNAKQNQLVNAETGDLIIEDVTNSNYLLFDLNHGVASDLHLVTEAAVIAGIQSQRVEIWTTWDNDNATTDVAFKTVVPQD